MPSNKYLSRRDAIKLLGATVGATLLAQLPSKWSKPSLTSGTLPAHAQTSQVIAPVLPTVSTDLLVDDIASPDITLNGTVVSDGGSPVLARGFVWSASPNVFLPTNDTPSGSGVGSFSSVISTASSPIYVKAYATNSVGTAYGIEQMSNNIAPVLPTVTTDAANDDIGSPNITLNGTVVSDGGAPILARGFVWSTSPGVFLPTNDTPSGTGVGSFTSVVNTFSSPIYVKAYATNSVGTAYGIERTENNWVCLAAGTLVTLADGTTKPIEAVNYADSLQVWNFDEGHFDAAQPLWIKKAELADRYNLLEFSDGSFLKTINQHRIFNKEQGRFTYPMTEDTPIGTTTFNVKGEEVTLVGKRVVNEPVHYYNVITYHHMNLFGNGILTSIGYNNLYPIQDMKFVKDDRELIPQEEYGLEDRFYKGLRLAEQDIPVADVIAYVNRRKALEVDAEPVMA